jgi:hypothetical protein
MRGWIVQDGVINGSCRGWQLGVDEVLRRNIEGAAAFYRDVWRCDLVTNQNNQIEMHQGRVVHLWHSLFVRAAGGYDVIPDRVREAVARELLHDATLSVAEVARRVGFASTPGFSRFIRRRTGEAASRLRG